MSSDGKPTSSSSRPLPVPPYQVPVTAYLPSPTASPSPGASAAMTPSSKLPKFLQSKASRERERSMTDERYPQQYQSQGQGQERKEKQQLRKTSKFLGINGSSGSKSGHQRTGAAGGGSSSYVDDPPVIVEPLDDDDEEDEGNNADTSIDVDPQRPTKLEPLRYRATTNEKERAAVHHKHGQSTPKPHVPILTTSSSSLLGKATSRSHPTPIPNNDNASYLHPQTPITPSHSTSRIGDLPTRLSGWFSHAFSTSATDLSLPSILSSHQRTNSPSTSSSPNAKSVSTATSMAALMHAAKTGKGHLDKAMRYLLDSDAVPDRCSDPIWLLGVGHRGYEGGGVLEDASWRDSKESKAGMMTLGSLGFGRRGSSSRPSSFRSSTSSSSDLQQQAQGGGLATSTSSSSTSHSSSQSHPPSSFRAGSGSVASSSTATQEQVQTSSSSPPSAAQWPASFYADFTSRIWLTYRSNFAQPIRDGRLVWLDGVGGEHYDGSGSAESVGWDYSSPKNSSGGNKPWNWPISLPGLGKDKDRDGKDPWGRDILKEKNHHQVGKTWSSDTGWGCMLRTGQSLLANALVFVHLGREWRRPIYLSSSTNQSQTHLLPQRHHNPQQLMLDPSYATYVQILTWFFDTPAPSAPFSVHRMALAGKELGTDVGMWFGPSVAAGAIKTLVRAYPDCGIAVCVATDSTLYQTQVFAASHGDYELHHHRLGQKGSAQWNPLVSTSSKHNNNNSDANAKTNAHTTQAWGDRPVLLLLGIRLGIDNVNPIYYETVKQLYTFPQSVGIAGGRPSSSYYFVGAQADSLFYLDPHHARPAVPVRASPSLPPRPSSASPPPPASPSSSANSKPSVNNAKNLSSKSITRRSGKSISLAMESKMAHASDGEVARLAGGSGRRQRQQKMMGRPASTPPSASDGPYSSSSSNSYATNNNANANNNTLHAPSSPSPLQHQFSTSSSEPSSAANDGGSSRPVSAISDDMDGGEEMGPDVEDYGVKVTEKTDSESSQYTRSPPPSYQRHSPGVRRREEEILTAELSAEEILGTDVESGDRQGHHGRRRSASASMSGQQQLARTGTRTDKATPGPNIVPPGPSSASPTPTTTSSSNTNHEQQQQAQQQLQGKPSNYTPTELRTYHCERVRKMPLSGLDPSMLVGFLCRDEREWWDLRRRVGELPKPIFSIQDEPPSWPTDLSDDSMGMESISEPDDTFMDDEDDELGEPSSGKKKEEVDDEEPDKEEEEGEGEEQFFDVASRSASASNSNSNSTSSHGGGQLRLASRPDSLVHEEEDEIEHGENDHHKREVERNEEDEKEDREDPLTPGPGTTRFAIDDSPFKVKNERKIPPEELLGTEDEDEEEFWDEVAEVPEPEFEDVQKERQDPQDHLEQNVDIEDDWVDPSFSSPLRPPLRDPPPVPPKASDTNSNGNTRIKAPKLAFASSSSSAASSSASDAGGGDAGSSKRSGKDKDGKKKRRKQTPVPVPSVHRQGSAYTQAYTQSYTQSYTHAQSQDQYQEHYPFPVTPTNYERGEAGYRVGCGGGGGGLAPASGLPGRMHTARARDGGRTQSGGVKAEGIVEPELEPEGEAGS